jgi:hypothetical protein
MKVERPQKVFGTGNSGYWQSKCQSATGQPISYDTFYRGLQSSRFATFRGRNEEIKEHEQNLHLVSYTMRSEKGDLGHIGKLRFL